MSFVIQAKYNVIFSFSAGCFNHKTVHSRCVINPLTPELNPSAQRCMTRFFSGDFHS
jgi:hypothetical protein